MIEFNKRTGFIYVRTQPGQTKNVFEQFKKHDWIIGAWAVAGEYDAILFVNANNYDELYGWANTVKKWDGIVHTKSHFTYNGAITTPTTLQNHGVWTHIRCTDVDNIMKNIRRYDYVTAWVNTPGDYDLLVWVNGKTLDEALNNVWNITQQEHWDTKTYVPVARYFNTRYANTI
jgi:hypothetical protein